MDSQTVLAGLNVLEIAEGVAGPMCGKVLGDLGATVTKVEPPGGDWLRRLVPTDDSGGAVYQQLNDGKDVLILDLTTPAGQERVRALAGPADICIMGQRQAKLAKLGLTYAALKAVAPRMVYCHVSGWGSAGPMGDRAASELCIQVVAGLTRYLGERGGPPVRQGFDLVSVDTGIAAAQAALAALLWRDQCGEGQYVEVSMLATAVALMQWDIAAESGPDRWQGRQLSAQDWPPDHGFQCADTRCLIDLRSNEESWPALLRDIGCPDLAGDPRFSTLQGLDLHATKLPSLTAGHLAAWSFADLERLVRDKYNGTIVPMLSLSDVVRHPQVQHIGVISAGLAPRIRFPMEVK
jgi:crotonobetainyl-CoA:carnitine CoA-transferase CaiB-like acyl-CoA transferase